jgi:hypothetical protein
MPLDGQCGAPDRKRMAIRSEAGAARSVQTIVKNEQNHRRIEATRRRLLHPFVYIVFP